MEGLEIEVKFHLSDNDALRSRILQIGAVSGGRVFESNLRFEDAAGSFAANRSLLRLRRDRKVRLTHKSTPLESDKRFKIRREIEVEVGSFDQMRQLLEALGYHVVQVYEKWRETFALDGVELCLDEMPYGTFLEIEGEPEAIMAAARRLDLDWNTRILANYLHIFELLRRESGISFTDLTFRNFTGISVDLTPILPLLQASG